MVRHVDIFSYNFRPKVRERRAARASACVIRSRSGRKIIPENVRTYLVYGQLAPFRVDLCVGLRICISLSVWSRCACDCALNTIHTRPRTRARTHKTKVLTSICVRVRVLPWQIPGKVLTSIPRIRIASPSGQKCTQVCEVYELEDQEEEEDPCPPRSRRQRRATR
jgi:hypothetical protein